MIPVDFEYYRPTSVAEAVDTYDDLAAAGKRPVYYGGGTEIITFGRLNELETGAVIDLKGIAACRTLTRHNGTLTLGAALTLSELTEANPWPLMTQSAGRIADHTTRCKITLGGNVASRIPYREAVLPLLVADAEVVVAGPDGQRQVPLRDVFDIRLELEPGQFLAQIVVDAEYLDRPSVGLKKTRLDWVDYPLVSVASLKKGDEIRLAITGLLPDPFRSREMEDELNGGGSVEQRVDRAIARLPGTIITDIEGSAEYRRFVLRNTLVDILHELEA